ncbi:unnamed protein product [Soboliphyme baturini]|uniref:ANK_REP_REGION domain-containing protein n=1 Tax=Soboliphyme baturini TaxID=241478 RepID=A0A183IP65_9BILA|nr:unnamed protein product [Soboliphyme baturini]
MNADPKAVDHEGRSALWYATNSKSKECADILLQNGCMFDIIQTPTTRRTQKEGGTPNVIDPATTRLGQRRFSSPAEEYYAKNCNDVFENLPASVI